MYATGWLASGVRLRRSADRNVRAPAVEMCRALARNRIILKSHDNA